MVEAQTLTVNTLSDQIYDGVCDDHCSLRDAVAAAADGDTIEFATDLPLPGTIELLSDHLYIDKDLAIVGPVQTS